MLLSPVRNTARYSLLCPLREVLIYESSVLDRLAVGKENNMKKQTKRSGNMLAEFDFSGGVRGKYATRYARGTNLVLLEPDVAKFFPTAEDVNTSLRALAGILRRRKKAVVAR